MKSLSRVIGMAVLACMPLCLSTLYAQETAITEVSMVRLLANPERYVGKQIYVMGFMHYRLEDACLYLTSEHANILDKKSGILIDIDSTDLAQLQKKAHLRFIDCDNKWVYLAGVFRLPHDPDAFTAEGGVIGHINLISIVSGYNDGKASHGKIIKSGKNDVQATH